MKKVKLTGKLSLKKETIAKLNGEQMNTVKGGTLAGCTYTCGNKCVDYTARATNCAACNVGG